MNLGIIYNNGRIVSHRSLAKVALNPFLRLMGWQIATLYDQENAKLGKVIITRCPPIILFGWHFKLKKNDIVVRDRMLV